MSLKEYKLNFMKNLKMFCTSLEPRHYEFIKELGYIPAAVGEKNFQDGWLRDNSKENISVVTIHTSSQKD